MTSPTPSVTPSMTSNVSTVATAANGGGGMAEGSGMPGGGGDNGGGSSAVTSVASEELTLESLDKECSALGGLFQQVVNDMKVRKSYNLFFILFRVLLTVIERLNISKEPTENHNKQYACIARL